MSVQGEGIAVGAPNDLRQRRREQTSGEIADAALDLFERQGAAATTVDQIAEAAGVSQRTFFRYFETKEDAAFWTSFWNTDRAFSVVDEVVAAIREGSDAVVAVERSCRRLLAEFATSASGSRRVLRNQRLVLSDPELLPVALVRNKLLVDQALLRVEGALGVPTHSIGMRAAVEFAFTTLRVTFVEWANSQDDSESVDIQSIFTQVVEVVRRINGGSTS